MANKYIYCTLFDSGYFSRGYLMMQSLLNTAGDCRLYILAMDQKCYDLMQTVTDNRVIVISLEDFLNEKLRKLKNERTHTEFCWSCSANLIEYVFSHYQEDFCTYIDADMFFYDNPNVLIDEMIQNSKSVQIMRHRIKSGRSGKKLEKESGIFCVEFNTFQNEPEARGVLSDWIKDIENGCTEKSDRKVFGDQLYLNKWPAKYSCVHINTNDSAGIAPWNINRYRLQKDSKSGDVLFYDGVLLENKIIFYHFHYLKQLDETHYDINVYNRFWHTDDRMVDFLYPSYIKNLRKIENEFNISPQIKSQKKLSFKEEIKQRLTWYYLKNIVANIDLRLKKTLNGKKDIIYVEM